MDLHVKFPLFTSNGRPTWRNSKQISMGKKRMKKKCV
ncbi:hypothetical protein F383_24145 [Gossypium arboreum]|uniref:Uncharacterized protein n=1 Tax=Gossypium arboreum TaxID=29729 RepID=A0A0B0P358_GOSAR|nr:hypothetical protein F383_24145 [Gossypium arboreum]